MADAKGENQKKKEREAMVQRARSSHVWQGENSGDSRR